MALESIFGQKAARKARKLGRNIKNHLGTYVVSGVMAAVSALPAGATSFNAPNPSAAKREFAPDRLVVRFANNTLPERVQRKSLEGIVLQARPGKGVRGSVKSAYGITSLTPMFTFLNGPGRGAEQLGTTYIAKVPTGSNLDLLVQQLARDPRIISARKDRKIYASVDQTQPDDEFYGSQKNLERLNYVQAMASLEHMRVLKDGKVIVYILDSGADNTKVELARYIGQSAVFNFVDDSLDVMDRGGHGTMVASNIVAETNNVEGIAGTVYRAGDHVEIRPVKILDDDGSGNASDLARGIEYAVNNDADFIVIAAGASGQAPDEVVSALELALSNDVHVFAATGNDGANEVHYPANSSAVYGIGAATSECSEVDANNLFLPQYLKQPWSHDPHDPSHPNYHPQN